MAMQIHGNSIGNLDAIRQGQGAYDHSATNYAERVKEKQAAERAEKVKEAACGGDRLQRSFLTISI